MPIRSTTLPAALLALCTFGAQASCPPAGWDIASLQRLRAAKFEGLAAAPRDALARSLLDCLADLHPEWRDEIAFEALAAWMRAGALSTETLQHLRRELSARLVAPDPQGFGRPFAALALAEVARVDRLKPYLTAEERAQLVTRRPPICAASATTAASTPHRAGATAPPMARTCCCSSG